MLRRPLKKQERLQAANNVLRSIAAIDRRIEMLEKQIRRASLSGCPAEMRAQSYDGVPGGGGYRSDTMEIARQILALKQQLTEETQRRRAITDAIFALDAYSAELLERRYIRGEQTDEIAAALTDFDEKRLPFKIVVDRACFAVCTASFRKGCNARLYRASVSQTFGDLPYRQILDAPRLRKPVFDFSDFSSYLRFASFCFVAPGKLPAARFPYVRTSFAFVPCIRKPPYC